MRTTSPSSNQLSDQLSSRYSTVDRLGGRDRPLRQARGPPATGPLTPGLSRMPESLAAPISPKSRTNTSKRPHVHGGGAADVGSRDGDWAFSATAQDAASGAAAEGPAYSSVMRRRKV